MRANFEREAAVDCFSFAEEKKLGERDVRVLFFFLKVKMLEKMK